VRGAWVACLLVACGGAPHIADVEAVLDDFHDAASVADEERYFAHFAPEGVFLGTDASERWTVDEFRAYAHPHFEKGLGWTYKARDRFVVFSPDGAVAWFDEMLDNTSYGELRGTGALRRIDGAWKIVQYNLTFTVPNDAVKDVVVRIKGEPLREVIHEGETVVLSMAAPHTRAPALYEDEHYSFWTRDSGSGGQYVPGIYAFRKKTGTWMQIRKLATAGAILGRSPGGEVGKRLPVSWDFSRWRDREFIDVPRPDSGRLLLPDRVVYDETKSIYKLQCDSDMAGRPGLGIMLTEFVIDKRELDAAFLR